MNTASLPADARPVPIAALAPFLMIPFGITWGLIGLYILVPEWMNATFGAISGSHPLFVLCVYAPAIAAFALVLYRGGLSGLRGFLSRLLLWRCPLPWALFLLVGIPLVRVNRHAMFARSGAATEVIPGSEAPGPRARSRHARRGDERPDHRTRVVAARAAARARFAARDARARLRSGFRVPHRRHRVAAALRRHRRRLAVPAFDPCVHWTRGNRTRTRHVSARCAKPVRR